MPHSISTTVRTLAAAVLALCACAPAPDEEDSTRNVTLMTEDGVRLAATLYLPSVPNPPGLILVHRAGGNRRAWDAFAERARREGYMCLACDLRGHGQSRSGADGGTLSFSTFGEKEWGEALNDLRAAKQALLAQGAAPDNLAVIGEAAGGSLALLFAHEDPGMQAITILSPGLAYQGLSIEASVKDLRKRPILLLTAAGDAYADASARTLRQAAPGFLELRTYPGSAHGAGLLVSAPESAGQILEWLKPIVGAGTH